MRFEYLKRNDFERKKGGIVTQNIVFPKYKFQINKFKTKMPTLTDRHFLLIVLFSKITCRDDYHEFELFGGLGGSEELPI